MTGSEPPAGWTGKLWALDRGFAYVEQAPEPPDFVLFTDADIAYRAPDAVRRLVEGALARGTVLTSLMVKLRCESFAERLLVPAFVFFFDMLYPFAWVNDPRRRIAAAAGGCMLVRRAALADAGGIKEIRGALIDDCALAALMKRQGPIWLGLTETRREPPALPEDRRHPPHGGALRLCGAPLFAASPRRHASSAWRSPISRRRFWRSSAQRRAAIARRVGVARDGGRLHADAPPLSAARRSGGSRFR